jgi:hypothetical protein
MLFDEGPPSDEHIQTSRQAEDSRAEAFAMSRNRHRSLADLLPLPSAMFKGTEVLARSS